MCVCGGLGGNFPDLRRSIEESLTKTGNSKQIEEGDVGSDAQAAKEGSSFKGAGWTIALSTSW